MNNFSLSAFEETLCYTFKDKRLLENALRHSSFVNEHPDIQMQDNERLEFLGDAVLSLVISHLLMDRFDELNEGDLSKIRSNLVNETRLAEIARKINVGQFICLGKGETQSGGRKKNSILSDTFEALLAAVYLDGGFDSAYDLISLHFSDFFNSVAFSEENQDFKSLLQEIVQAEFKSDIIYNVISESGPDHDKTFDVELTIAHIHATGQGKSKKAAEQNAAQNALNLLKKDE
jgi:ribonuclease-3